MSMFPMLENFVFQFDVLVLPQVQVNMSKRKCSNMLLCKNMAL